MNHQSDIQREDPLLLDPAGEDDPADHVGFRGHICVSLSRYGSATIDVVGLNRPELKEQRLAHLQKLWSTFELSKLPQIPEATRKRARRLLEGSMQIDAEYSAATKSAIADEFEYVPPTA